MPTDKRQRQREGREARRAAARAAQRRAARRRQIISIVALLAVVAAIGFGISQTGSDEPQDVAAGADNDANDTPSAKVGDVACPPAAGADKPRRSFPGRPKMCLEDGRDYEAVIATDLGEFTIDLDPQTARETVNNFVFLSRYRAYDDTPFERVIPGFVVQGGNLRSPDAREAPGYFLPDEFPPDKSAFKEGTVAMANRGPNTSSAGFFVLTNPAALVGHQYSIFGTVTQGMEVVKAIEADGTQAGRPRVTHKVVKVTINEKEA